jgi:hypothetical protein
MDGVIFVKNLIAMKMSFLSGLLGVVALMAFGACFMVEDPIEAGFLKALSLGALFGFVKWLSNRR